MRSFDISNPVETFLNSTFFVCRHKKVISVDFSRLQYCMFTNVYVNIGLSKSKLS